MTVCGTKADCKTKHKWDDKYDVFTTMFSFKVPSFRSNPIQFLVLHPISYSKQEEARGGSSGIRQRLIDDKPSFLISKTRVPKFLDPNPSPHIATIMTRSSSSSRTLELIKPEMRSKEPKLVCEEMAYDDEEEYTEDDRRACVEVDERVESDVVGDSVAESRFG